MPFQLYYPDHRNIIPAKREPHKIFGNCVHFFIFETCEWSNREDYREDYEFTFLTYVLTLTGILYLPKKEYRLQTKCMESHLYVSACDVFFIVSF